MIENEHENEDIIDTSIGAGGSSGNSNGGKQSSNEESKQMNDDTNNNNSNTDSNTDSNKNEPYCHFIFLPGQNVNVSNYTCFKCMKMKEKGNILSTLGLKSSKYYEVNYLIFINEVFLYYIVDTTNTLNNNTNNSNIMRIESKSNLNDLINFYLNKVDDANIYRFDLEFAGENKNEEVSLFFQEKEINDFLILFQEHLVKLGILHIQQEQTMENEEGENEYNDEYMQSGSSNVDKESETGSNSNTTQLKEDDKYNANIDDNDNQYDYGDDEGNGTTSMKKPKHKKKKKKQPKKQTESLNEVKQ